MNKSLNITGITIIIGKYTCDKIYIDVDGPSPYTYDKDSEGCFLRIDTSKGYAEEWIRLMFGDDVKSMIKIINSNPG